MDNCDPNRAIRIAHVNLSKDFRGGERQTLALVEAFNEPGFRDDVRQIVVTRRNSRMEQAGSAMTGIDLRPVSPSIMDGVRAVRDADIVHVHEGRSTQVGAIGSLSGTPFIVTRRVPKCPKNFFLTRWCYGRAARITCVSERVAGVMRGYLPAADVSVIPDCVRTLSPAENMGPFVVPGDLVVATIGELDIAVKGQDRIIAAARALRSSHPKIQFWIIGEGKDEERLKELARGLDCVKFFGWVPNVGDYLAKVDVLAHPARSEGLGSVMLEAMAASVPVIASNVDGIPEIVCHEHNGLLFDTNDPDGLLNALERVMSDRPFRSRLGDHAKTTAQRYSAQHMASRYYAAYRSALGNCAMGQAII